MGLLGSRCEQKAVGQESAKVGQGKAMKAGWIKKDKDTFRVNVILSNGQDVPVSAEHLLGRIHHRHKSRTATDNTKHAYLPRSKSHYRSEEAEVIDHTTGHKLQNWKGPQICCRIRKGRDRLDSRNAG